MRRWKMILLPLLLIVLAAPLSAYTIYLKDGTRIVAKQKYRVDEDGKAIITLQNGTQTFIKSSEIDVDWKKRRLLSATKAKRVSMPNRWRDPPSACKIGSLGMSIRDPLT